MLVAENLEQYRGNDVSPYIYLINEGIKFSSPKDAIQKAVKVLPRLNTSKRLNVITMLFMLFIGQTSFKPAEKNLVKTNPIIKDLAEDNDLTYKEIVYTFEEIANEYKKEKTPIIRMSKEIIDTVNKIKPGLYSEQEIDLYNKYDKEIIRAVTELNQKGENADADLIKSFMLIETGMKPKKNSLGFEGFPQTKKHIIDWINEKYATNFTLSDMYNPYKSAKFIHYYLKAIKRSKFVNDLDDMVIAYNWGTTNLGKYKANKKQLPKESEDYVKMMKILSKYFT